MKGWKLILIPIVLIILAVGGALAYNWWYDSHRAPGTGGTMEGYLQGVADWAKGEQGLELLGEYTFVTTEEIDKSKVKKVYAYQLSDGSVYGWLSYYEEQRQEWLSDWAYVASGTCVDYAKALAEAEAQYREKDLFLGDYSLNGLFFAIGDTPETLAGYFVSCTEGLTYRIHTQRLYTGKE
ncbi:MAG: hypothetical protein IKV99_03630 [Oscillospiraceae bacterium]|nr:hypothetical protein [Oscillospiraceae bacterium]